MAKDEWKKTRDIEHAKGVRFELAAGLPPSDGRPWETENDGLVSDVAPPSFEDAAPTLLPGIRTWLEQLGGTEKEATEAAERLEELGPEHAEAVPVLIDALRHSNAVVQRTAIKTLVQIRKPAVPALSRLLENGAWQEQDCAAQCLGGIGSSASSEVMRLMNSGKPLVRDYASKAAGMGAVPHDLLWNILVKGTSQQKRTARDAFVASGSNAVPFLLERLDRETLDHGLIAVSVLGDLGGKAAEALPALTEIVKHADEHHVRVAVSWACNAIRLAKKRRDAARKEPSSPLKPTNGQNDLLEAAGGQPDDLKPKTPRKAK